MSSPLQSAAAAKKDNKMREIVIEKLVLNISTGQSGDRLTFAGRVLEQLTGQKPCFGRARYTVRQFNIRRNETISAYVTVRGPKAVDLLERGLKVKEYELKRSNFSTLGEHPCRARRCLEMDGGGAGAAVGGRAAAIGGRYGRRGGQQLPQRHPIGGGGSSSSSWRQCS